MRRWNLRSKKSFWHNSINLAVKILHIEAGRFLYGGAQQVSWLTHGLAAKGVQNVLVCPEDGAIQHAVAEGTCVHAIPMKGDVDIGLVLRLVAIIRAETPDLIHIHSRRGADIFGGIAARIAGVPCVLSRRVDNVEPRWWAPLKYGLYDRVIVISEAIGRVLVGCGVDARSITVVRSAVDSDTYNLPIERSWFQDEFSLPSDEMTLGVVAQLIPRKGHRYLLEVLPELLVAYPNLHVLIFGQGPLESELTQAVQHPDFDGRVHMVGFRNDLRRVMPNLYAVIHPAEKEGLGVALLQASACSVPVVAARAGGIPEVVRHDENGLTFDVGDVGALKQHLVHLLSDRRLRDRLGEEGRRLATSAFSIDAMVEGNLAVYHSLLEA